MDPKYRRPDPSENSLLSIHDDGPCVFPPPPSSTRLVFLVSGGPGRPPLSGHSVATGLRNKLRKQKTEFLIFKAHRVDTVSEYPSAGAHAGAVLSNTAPGFARGLLELGASGDRAEVLNGVCSP